MKPIAHIRSDFPAKFGIPRQAGLVAELKAQVVFEPEFRNPEALRGIDGFSHLWLIWEFSQNRREGWSPTVRPPRLGGNVRMGVFATRSPFRPNPIGLSCVQLDRVEWDGPQGPVLRVLGADLMDGTPIYDIKPYVPYADCRPEATQGFAPPDTNRRLEVEIPEELEAPVAEGAVVGTVRYTLDGKLLAEVEVLAGHAVPRMSFSTALRMLWQALTAGHASTD